MRLSMVSSGARPTLSDRAPTPQIFGYEVNTVAPHTSTSRWSYTVPAGRKFQMAEMTVIMTRDAIATVLAQCYIATFYTPFGGVIKTVTISNNYINTIGDERPRIVPSTAVLNAGDIFSCNSVDASTSGSTHPQSSMMGTEGDV